MQRSIQVHIDYEALEAKIQDAIKDMSVPVSVHLVTKREVYERKESRAKREPLDQIKTREEILAKAQALLDAQEANVPVATSPRHEFTKPMKVSSR